MIYSLTLAKQAYESMHLQSGLAHDMPQPCAHHFNLQQEGFHTLDAGSFVPSSG
jgi:hypothetical protein